MVEQAEFLEHDADMPAHLEQRILVERAHVPAEHPSSLPRLGFSDSSSSSSRVVLPEPDGPVRK